MVTAPSEQTATLLARPALRPFLKWPGGKGGEFPTISAAAPPLTGRYIDPFVGGGSVLLAVPSVVQAEANDACPELIGIYTAIAGGDAEVRSALLGVASVWDVLSGADADCAGLVVSYRADTLDDALAPWTQRLLVWARSALDGAGPGADEAFADRLLGDMRAKVGRMKAVEAKVGRPLSDEDLAANIEGAAKAAFFYALRGRYNAARMKGQESPWRLADFLFLREFAYASMFRFNARGEFNVPYGGVSYNRKSMMAKVDLAYAPDFVERLAATGWHIGDFEPFLEAVRPAGQDFVFVDPPYDSEFSDYDNRPFGASDQARLEGVLRGLDCPVMVVIKASPAIEALYDRDHWSIRAEDKTYMWTIKSRNDRAAVHLTITNY